MSGSANHTGKITIRVLRAQDGELLARLAERDTTDPPAGRVLGAFSGDVLVAARSLTSGRATADPFRRTAEARSLLERRAAQLGDRRRGRGLGGLLRRRSRAALPSSPPGGGGRLLTLPPPPDRC